MKKMQQGVALLVAMLVVAIAAMIATQIFYQQQIAIRRTLNQLQAEQLYQLELSTEAWTKVILKEDTSKNNFDYIGDVWAQRGSLFDAEGAVIKTVISDYQSCFNLNNLVLGGKAQPAQITILQNLMSQLKLNPQLVWSVVDWLDVDDEPNSAGAEFETYSRLTPAYRTANFRMIELTELYAILGWKIETVNVLSPYICVLPPAPEMNNAGRFYKDTAFTTININTASEIILRSLSVDMRTANLGTILEYRKTKGYATLDLFISQLDKDNPRQPKISAGLKKELLSVDSHYFMLEYSGWLDQMEQNYRSLIYRKTSATNATANPTTNNATSTANAATEDNATPAAEDGSNTQTDAAVADEDGAVNTATQSTNQATNTTNPTNTATSANTTTAASPINPANVQINTLYRLQYY